MREVRVDGERFLDAELFHHDKAQTIHKAVGLVLVSLAVVEGGSFLVRRRPVDSRKLLRVELLTECGGLLMANLARQRNGLGDDVIRRQQVIGESNTLKCSEDLDDSWMMGVSLGDECEAKSGVEEGHTFGRP